MATQTGMIRLKRTQGSKGFAAASTPQEGFCLSKGYS